MPKCDCCGRFMQCIPGASWAMRYSGVPLSPDHEVFRCIACTSKVGALVAQHGIRPEYGAGIIQ